MILEILDDAVTVPIADKQDFLGRALEYPNLKPTRNMPAASDTARWRWVDACPSCGANGKFVGRLRVDQYVGIPKHERQPSVSISGCENCGLIYKNVVPSPPYLAHLTKLQEADLWADTYAYGPEIVLLDKLTNGNAYDILDVGSAGGGLIRALDRRNGRHSALDIVKFDRLQVKTGEFIEGFLDDNHIRWSGIPYDVVTVFDVMEHLYEPQIAMQNLREFCKPDGWVIIETGDSDCISRPKLPTWGYLSFYQHHIVWNRQSLARAASASGFEIVSLARKQHKLVIGEKTSLQNRVKHALYSAAPDLYQKILRLAKSDAYIPAGAQRVDHMQLVLRATGTHR